jgi:hypothetical protein
LPGIEKNGSPGHAVIADQPHLDLIPTLIGDDGDDAAFREVDVFDRLVGANHDRVRRQVPPPQMRPEGVEIARLAISEQEIADG